MKRFFYEWRLPLLYSLGIFGYPLVAIIPVIFNIEGRLSSIFMRLIVVCISVQILITNRKIFIHKYLILLLAFWLLYSLRILEAISDGIIVSFFTNFDFLAFAYGTCFIPMFALATQTRYSHILIQRILSLTFLITLFSTAVNSYLSISSVKSRLITADRLFTDSLNPISLGHLGASLALLSFFKIFLKKLPKDNVLIYYVSFVIGLFTVLISASKGPLVALIITTLICIFLKTSLNNIFSNSIFFIILSFLFSPVLDYLNNFGIDPFARYNSGLEGDASTLGRIDTLQLSINQFISNPLFGSGIVELTTGYYPHNLIIESFMATGLLGGTLFTYVFCLSFFRSIILIKYSHYSGWVGLICIQYLVGSLFSNSLFGCGQFWISMASVFAMHVSYKNSNINNK